MIRQVTLLISLVAGVTIATGAVVEHKTRVAQAELSEIRRSTAADRASIEVLSAEWAHLTAPQRVAGLTARHLEMRPLEVRQLTSIDALPERQTPPAAAEIASLLPPEVVRPRGEPDGMTSPSDAARRTPPATAPAGAAPAGATPVARAPVPDTGVQLAALGTSTARATTARRKPEARPAAPPRPVLRQAVSRPASPPARPAPSERRPTAQAAAEPSPPVARQVAANDPIGDLLRRMEQ